MTNKIRRYILDSAYYAKHGHMPSALSIVEIICAFDKIKNVDFIKKQIVIDQSKIFIETGANMGNTLHFVSRNYDIKSFSCEGFAKESLNSKKHRFEKNGSWIFKVT